MLDKQLGSYRITQKLAEGGMGEVYIAQHELMDREAVVKVLHPKLSHDEEVVRRFLNEARAAASINHPGIVAIYDLGRAGGQVYIVMERLYGETLAERVARAPVEPDQAVAMSKQLASALAAAHNRDIVHRDLKPENIFVVSDPDVPGGERIKVLDFGVAKLAPTQGGGNLTAQGTIFGTPAYMAPEQCQNAARVDHRTDLYAIGCIMYEMLCGRPPFGKGGLELLAAHLRDQPQPPSAHNPAVPQDLEDATLKLLAKQPEARFQSCEELLEALGGADMIARSGAPRQSNPNLAYAATVLPASPSQPPAPGTAPGTAPFGSADRAMNAVALSPTTYRSASGQVDTVSAEGRKLGVFTALALLAAGAAAAVFFFMIRGQDSDALDTPEASQAAAAAEQTGETGEAAPERALIAEAEEALAERRWEDALVAAAQGVGVATEGSEIQRRAQEIQEIARQGQKDALSYEIFRKAAQAQDVRTAVYAYEQLGDDSRYRDDAAQDYEAMRDQWMAPRLARAQAYLDKGRCSKIPSIAQEVGFLFPESMEAVGALHDQCRDDKKSGGGESGDGEDPAEAGEDPAEADEAGEESRGEEAVAKAGEGEAKSGEEGEGAEAEAAEDLPEKLTRAEVLKHLAPIRKELVACKRRFYEEAKEGEDRDKDRGDVTLTFEISPKGKLKTIAMDAGVPLKRCLWLHLRTIQFPPAQDVTQVSYPLGRNAAKKRKRKRRKRRRPARSIRR